MKNLSKKMISCLLIFVVLTNVLMVGCSTGISVVSAEKNSGLKISTAKASFRNAGIIFRTNEQTGKSNNFGTDKNKISFVEINRENDSAGDADYVESIYIHLNTFGGNDEERYMELAEIIADRVAKETKNFDDIMVDVATEAEKKKHDSEYVLIMSLKVKTIQLCTGCKKMKP